MIHAALQGVGVAYLYEEYVARMIADGRLVSILRQIGVAGDGRLFLFYPSRRQNSAALRALIDFLRSELRQNGEGAKGELTTTAQGSSRLRHGLRITSRLFGSRLNNAFGIQAIHRLTGCGDIP